MKKRHVKAPKAASKKKVAKNRFFHNFTGKNLQNVFEERISHKDNAGVDGIHAHDINDGELFEIIDRKASAGTYHFTPYAEIQLPKGRGKPPRILALPTVRDQTVLSALKDYLHEVFPDSVNRKLPNSYIFELTKEIQDAKKSGQSFGFIHTDISGFYDNIDREILMNLIRTKIRVPEALKLIYQAIVNPIVPRNSKRSQRFHYYTPKGIPQGLAISNILANIYMSHFDPLMKAESQYYIRYVDDILVLCPKEDIFHTLEKLHYEVSKRGLTFNKEKTKIGDIGHDSFDFLGYTLKTDGRISVRDTSVHRKITSLAAKISFADHKRKEFLKLHNNVDKKVYKRVLIEDINEQITGAIGGSRRYGWLFYFSQMNDMALLHRLDRTVTKLCRRCTTFSFKMPKGVKSFVTAFREIHKLGLDNHSSYIPNYDTWTLKEKTKLLRNRGQLIEGKRYTEEEINSLMYKRWRSLEEDLRNMS